MTNNTSSEDLRDKALLENAPWVYTEGQSVVHIKNAMDSYWALKAKELLKWMAQNKVECDADSDIAQMIGEQTFLYKGNWVTLDELFENFL